MRIAVLSLGGSLIIPDKVDYNFLKNFKKSISKFKNLKFVIVTGGGKIARMYIDPLRREGLSEERACLVGIKATKLNAFFLSNFLNANKLIPDSVKEVENALKKNKVVVCGALGYQPNMTSDGNAAELAKYFKTELINMTNVKGLYDKDPRKFKDARLIKEISFDGFWKVASRIKFKAGQHFVLDQSAAKIIRKSKIKTFIIGQNLKNFENLLKKKKFVGSVIY